MKKLFILSTIALSAALSSCDKFMDINKDPNSPDASALTTDMLFPAAEMNIAGSYGDFLRICGGYFSQHYSQTFGTSNYLDYSQFTMSATRSSSTYQYLNARALSNLKTVREKAVADGDFATNLAATTLWAFTYQVLVDCYGELPYSDSFKGNPMPKYDEGADIYAGVIKELEEALAQPLNSQTCTNFLFPSKSSAEWEAFANAVLLKLYMRESGVADVQSKLDALVAENNFPESDVAYTNWSNEAGHMSPFYAEEFATNWGSTQVNVIGNIAIIRTMQQLNADGDVVFEDGRLEKFFQPNNAGNYTGGVSGTNFATAEGDQKSATYWNRPVASFDMPVYMITRSEIEFFLAEYYAKKANAGEAQAHYNAAIEASFASAGAEGADEAIDMFPYKQANYKECIGISKWIALAGTNPFESWCEMRRLGYPAFGSVSGNDLYNMSSHVYSPEKYVPGTLYTPIQVNGNLGAGKILQRFPYAESSSTRNSNAPKQTEAVYGTPVFWAAK